MKKLLKAKKVLALLCAFALVSTVLPGQALVGLTAFAATNEQIEVFDEWSGADIYGSDPSLEITYFNDSGIKVDLIDLVDGDPYTAVITADGYEEGSGIVTVTSGTAELTAYLTPIATVDMGAALIVEPEKLNGGDGTLTVAAPTITTTTGESYTYTYTWKDESGTSLLPTQIISDFVLENLYAGTYSLTVSVLKGGVPYELETQNYEVGGITLLVYDAWLGEGSPITDYDLIDTDEDSTLDLSTFAGGETVNAAIRNAAGYSEAAWSFTFSPTGREDGKVALKPEYSITGDTPTSIAHQKNDTDLSIIPGSIALDDFEVVTTSGLATDYAPHFAYTWEKGSAYAASGKSATLEAGVYTFTAEIAGETLHTGTHTILNHAIAPVGGTGMVGDHFLFASEGELVVQVRDLGKLPIKDPTVKDGEGSEVEGTWTYTVDANPFLTVVGDGETPESYWLEVKNLLALNDTVTVTGTFEPDLADYNGFEVDICVVDMHLTDVIPPEVSDIELENHVMGPDNVAYYDPNHGSMAGTVTVQDIDLSPELAVATGIEEVDVKLYQLTGGSRVEIDPLDGWEWEWDLSDPDTDDALTAFNTLKNTAHNDGNIEAVRDAAMGPHTLTGDLRIYKNSSNTAYALEDGAYILEITATDRGNGVDIRNTGSSEIRFNLTTKAPEIQVEYLNETFHTEDGNSIKTATDGRYHYQSKGVQVTVTDHFFNPTVGGAGGAFALGLTLDGSDIANKGAWKKTGDNTYTWALEFDADGQYDFTGLTVTSPSTKETSYTPANEWDKSFVIDKTSPILYTNASSFSAIYYNTDKTLTLRVTEANLSQADLLNSKYSAIKVTHNGNNIPLALSDISVNSAGDLVLSRVFGNEGDYVVSGQVWDYAGNASGRFTFEFTVDKTDPDVTVAFGGGNASNANYLAANRSVNITIAETNFNTDKAVATVRFYNRAGTLLKTHVLDTWKDNGNNTYAASLNLTDEGRYTFAIEVTDKAGNTTTGNTGRPDDLTFLGNTGDADRYEFWIDKSAPTGRIIETTTTTTWDNVLHTVTFGLYSNTHLEVRLEAEDAITQVDTLEYIKLAQPLDANSNSALLSALAARTDWTSHSVRQNDTSFSFTLRADEQFVYYMRVTDMAGNVTYYNSGGMIVDTSYVVETVEPQVTVTPVVQPVNDIYNGNVDVAVTAFDPLVGGTFSGLADVSYEVTSLGAVTQSGTLHSFTDPSPTLAQIQSNQAWAGTITVDAGLNNSNEVVITVTATDRAGNTTVESAEVQIDTTAPTIAVSYNNNSVLNDKYFKESRTATVVVTERNFDPNNTPFDTNGSISGWRQSHSGTGNGDDITWTATVSFDRDDDFKFDVRTTDLAGNTGSEPVYGDSAAPKEFTVDLTVPTITVTYDNNSAQNESYYNEYRTATITIDEHNFDASDVEITVTATLDGAAIPAPAAGGFSSSGDNNTASISYSADGLYTFDISYTDLAGNEAEAFVQDSFTVDTTAPTVEIAGIEDKSANNGAVAPVLSFGDINFNTAGVEITLSGHNNGRVDMPGSTSNTAQGSTFTFDDFARVVENDDVYTLTGKVTDMAGNEAEETILFSVNRFGSNYIVEHAGTFALLENYYTNTPPEIQVKEINVDTLEFREITLTVGNDVDELAEGEDYSVEETGGEASWKEYTYTIFEDNFTKEGVYTVTIYSEDTATNTASNRAAKNEEYAHPIEFVLDMTPPSVVIAGVEQGGSYNEPTRTANIDYADNIAIESLQIFNGSAVVAEYSAADLSETAGLVQFELTESTTEQSISVLAVDKAGNSTQTDKISFLLTTNPFVRFINNTPLLIGSIAGVVVLAGLAVFIVLRSKNKKPGKEEKKAA